MGELGNPTVAQIFAYGKFPGLQGVKSHKGVPFEGSERFPLNFGN